VNKKCAKKVAIIKDHIIFVTGRICTYEITALLTATASRKWGLN